MNLSQDGAGGQDAPFVPFTKAERIQQLGQIDKDIVSLLRSVGRAVQSLGSKDTPNGEESTGDNGQDTQVFQDSMNDFIKTLRSVNTGMKRQIWGLEEAGIVTLRKEDGEQPQPNAPSQPSKIEPDGDGKIGGMDVGWLNSHSNKVENDMESELWDQAEKFLRQTLEKSGSIEGQDSEMTS